MILTCSIGVNAGGSIWPSSAHPFSPLQGSGSPPRPPPYTQRAFCPHLLERICEHLLNRVAYPDIIEAEGISVRCFNAIRLRLATGLQA